MKQSHYLIIEDHQGVRGFVLDAPTYSIGRDPKCDIHLISQFVSRHSATLIQQLREDGSSYYRIIDGSLAGTRNVNGLLINGYKLQAHNLKNGDSIVVGPGIRMAYILKEKDGRTEKCDFLFQCSQTWKDLQKTSDSEVRYCSECQQEVYRVDFGDLKNQPTTQKCLDLDFDSDVLICFAPNPADSKLNYGEER